MKNILLFSVIIIAVGLGVFLITTSIEEEGDYQSQDSFLLSQWVLSTDTGQRVYKFRFS
ncbi:MAG: hypothetical protein O2887_08685 [Bacteroidetes bacterium]|nr:hypothetical protein [Bacteroidota bacterium]MDA1120552.1 hypothetical protein [Bacteroidota bacterium]